MRHDGFNLAAYGIRRFPDFEAQVMMDLNGALSSKVDKLPGISAIEPAIRDLIEQELRNDLQSQNTFGDLILRGNVHANPLTVSGVGTMTVAAAGATSSRSLKAGIRP
ncbi:hypothetical protein [Sphingobium lactosutens]|jgi:hypothetical protein|uniref:hypothetical protein n=1 Tax=Sphingobium lactosutens TaxID=522773 RepID=UPI001D191592|nr:hypothetical protein [Sphingobium lactosutens]MCC4258038.1 hypothetical protein [Sphingobium lactosutens]